MTTFDDVTRSFNEGLSAITSYIPKVISNFQNADQHLRDHKNNLVDSYEVKFAGMGATMFAQAVENNIAISSRMEQKLSEFGMSSDHINKQIHTMNQTYGSQIDNYIPPSVMAGDIGGLDYYGMSYQDATTQMRDDTLISYVDVGGVLDLGKSYLLSQLEQAKEGIWGYLQYKSSQNMQQYQNIYDTQTSRVPKDATAMLNEYKQMHNQSVQQENNYLAEAKNQLGQIYTNQQSAFSDWYDAVSGLIGIYNDEIGWASATGTVTTGEILQDLIHAPNGSPIVIYQTNDGGLVVAVNSMGGGKTPQQNALLVQQAIQEYDAMNGITNPRVTILGYQGGNDIVQALAQDKNPFQLENVVLIGAQISQIPAGGINYYDYVAPGDNNAGTGNPSIVPQSPTDWASDGIDIGEIALGATGGPAGVAVATGEVIVGTAVPMWLNSNTGDVSGAANSGTYFKPPASLGPGDGIGVRNLTALPDEPGETKEGWKLSSHFPFVYGKSVDYTQSTFLNMVGLPSDSSQDPKKFVQGFQALSGPTYFNVPTS
ncbi:hypothetical protein [Dictyobacter aurantiacus]|uniref:Uncharacterized protein n=1 Tax=Dictyobacter aurantiacus TaxID=1936993 RepID=A0A401ZJT7_9CHLR|nr:hypothetical protein [Dictyobacter aurantiacus]GCE07090.1 hypothetical protein KDAU_44190 [Dictyobacter aurantiacus]